MPASKPSTSAFTLVELSIVLVILGLLVGGVLAGQSLIRAAELRTTSADISRYRTSLNAFRDKIFRFAWRYDECHPLLGCSQWHSNYGRCGDRMRRVE